MGAFLPSRMCTAPPPRYTAICLGWLGSKDHHLQKYADIHLSLGASRVLVRTSSVTDLFLSHHNINNVALSVIKDVSLGARPDGPDPVILHAFSNGGAFVVWKLMALLDSGAYPGFKIAGIVWDSAPATVTADTGASAFSSSIRYQWLQAPAYHIVRGILRIALLLKSYRRALDTDFWSAMASVPYASLYIYSTADRITLAAPLSALILERTHRLPTLQRSLVLSDSGHVRHLVMYPAEYVGAMTSFLQEVLPRVRPGA